MTDKKSKGGAKVLEGGAEQAGKQTVVLSQDVVARPPTPGAPHAPTDFQPTDGIEVQRFLKVTEGQARIADGFIAEILGSQSFAKDFGDRVPSPQKIAELVKLALLWDAEQKAAERWYAFAKEQRLRTWDAAMQQIQELQIEFDHRTSRDNDLRDRYPKTDEFLGKRREYAAQAAETRKANQKAKKSPSPA
jgi:hypothetical protein